MKREDLIQEILAVMRKAGFSSSDPALLRHSGFDIVARRGSLIMVIKAVSGEGMSRESLFGMVALARAVEGTPVIIGPGSSSGTLEDEVLDVLPARQQPLLSDHGVQ